MRKMLKFSAILLGLTASTHAQIQIVNPAENTIDWGSAAALSQDAFEGRFSIVFDVPDDRTGFLSLII